MAGISFLLPSQVVQVLQPWSRAAFSSSDKISIVSFISIAVYSFLNR